MYVCMYVCMYMCVYVCMYVCMYVYVYVCVCVCIKKIVGINNLIISVNFINETQRRNDTDFIRST
jgi:hypothetical protein